MDYTELFKELNSRKIRYLVCGGMAVNIHGIPRMTADIDLLLDFEKKNIVAFETAMKKLSYFSTIPIFLNNLIDKSARLKIIKTKNLIAYSYFNSRANTMNVDVLVDVPIEFESIWKDREVRKGEDYYANFVSVNHLIEMKKYSDREQDKQDVLLLSKIKNGEKKKKK